MKGKKQRKTSREREETSELASVEPVPINQKTIYEECCNEPWFFGYVQGKALMPYLKQPGDFAVCYMDQLEIIVKGDTSSYITAAMIDNCEIKISTISKSFNSVKKMVAEMTKRRFKLIKSGEKVRPVRPMETPPWILSKEFVNIGQKLESETDYHKVYDGKLFDKIDVLIKMTSHDHNRQTIEKTNRVLSNECQRLVNLKHPNLTLVYGLVCTDLPVQLVFESSPGRTLKEFLILHGSACSDVERYKFAMEITNALVYVHEQNIVHRQVVVDKCYVSIYGHLKLSGFGLANTPEELNDTKPEILTQQNIPIRAMPPECLTNKPWYSLSCDIWSFGVFMYEVFYHGESPWPDLEPKRIATAIRKVQMPLLPQKMPQEAKEFVETKCWVKDPKCRAKIGEIKIFLEEQLKSLASSGDEGPQEALKVISGVEPLTTSQVEQKHEQMIQAFNDLRSKAIWIRKGGPAKSVEKKKKVIKKTATSRSTTNTTTNNTTCSTPKDDSQEKLDRTQMKSVTSKATSKSTTHKSEKKAKKTKTVSNNAPPPKLPRPLHAHHEIDDDYSGSLKDEK
ncbi:unnamed protein product [Bursaphelenchus okinawaensis]|uniref:Protein kinase domain-containing protein n=1 Tax=Bursaphelenchus okinawaensis TaxID=465554 RepID=A0A811L8S4_9BILA|nr:unnamed protein product [Bursaphelenchus okinawaensis]CAG9118194.1 unnamed protein product [Bursaphelenchus okinawaensis]